MEKQANTDISTPRVFVYDIESYPNFFLAVFKEITQSRDGPSHVFTWDDADKLKAFVSQQGLTLVGYNNFEFDDPLIRLIIAGQVKSSGELNRLVEEHIAAKKNAGRSPLRADYESSSSWTCIDLMQILGGLRRAGSLKSHEIRLAMLNVQDLPFPPGAELTAEQKKSIVQYCRHDVNATEELYFDCLERIDVRHGVNAEYPYLKASALRRSDASIAEEVMIEELTIKAGFNRAKHVPPTSFIFNPAEQIHPSIEFSGHHNRAMLCQLKGLPETKTENWSDDLCQRFAFKVGSHVITINRGGLHTSNPALFVKSDAIVECDVASYYPSLLRKFDRSPKGISSKWVEIFNGLTDKRLKAKQEGNKPSADVQKIIINSIYGKLGDEFSINRDDSLQMQVVINGQLFLLMLMERFSDAGFDVIAANTDGLYVNAGKRIDDVKGIAKQWMQDTGFALEFKTSTIFAASSVNNYALYAPDRGWFHKKGQFAIGQRTSPAVITEAVLNHISSGEPIETYIRSQEKVFDFLYSRSVKTPNTTLTHGEITLQKTNRWYRSTAGFPILSIRSDKHGTLKKVQVQNSESCKVVNCLASTGIPADLDYVYYVQQATELLHELQSGHAPSSKIEPKLIGDALKAQKRGYAVVPKGYPGSDKANVKETFDAKTIEYWRTTPLDQAEWRYFVGFGTYTGPEFGIIAIDVDHPDVARKAGLFDQLTSASAVAWHGDCTAADVRTGKARGTLLFKYDGHALRSTSGSFLESYGFEILYGKKVAQLAGRHPNGERYRYAGKLKTMPASCADWLEAILPERHTISSNVDSERDVDVVSELLSRFREAANADEEYIAVGGRVDFDRSDDSRLTGICVGHQLHTATQDKNRPTMTIAQWRGRLKVNCFHHSCDGVRRAWEAKIHGLLNVFEKVVIKPERIVTTAEMQDVAEALKDPAQHKLIVAPTGSGKSYGIANYIVPFLDSNSGNKDKFVIVCSSKDEMTQIAFKISDILETKNINKLGIELIEAGGAISIHEAKSQPRVSEGARVAITHYTYVSRRGFSQFYYSFLKFIDATTQVFVDEVDAFIDSQTTCLPLGSRWKQMSRGGITQNVKLGKCGMFHSFNNCMNCTMRKYEGFRLALDQYGNQIYQPIGEFIEGDAPQKLEHIDVAHRVKMVVPVGTTEISMLRQEEDPGLPQFEERGQETRADFAEIFSDHMNAAYLPTIHRPMITVDNVEIKREDLVRKYYVQSGAFAIPEEDLKAIRFPSRVCNVLTVTLIDRRPLTWMAKAKSFTGLTATITPQQRQFLRDTLADLKEVTITPNEERKMDKIIAIGMTRQLPVSVWTDEIPSFPRMFRFRETRAKAEEDFQKLKRSNVVTKMGISKWEFRVSREQSDDHQLLLTYSFGSLGRGVDLADYDLVDVNASIYKPIAAYVTDDPVEIRTMMNDDRANMLTQNIGRILRRSTKSPDAIKIVLLEELEGEDEYKAVVTQLQSMSHLPVESWWVPEFIDRKEVCASLSAIFESKSIPADLPRDPLEMIPRAKKLVDEGLSRKEVMTKLRWKTIRKRLSPDIQGEIETQIEKMFSTRPATVRREKLSTPEKTAEKREKRLLKIRELIGRGKSDAQIRNNMKVDDAKRPWPEIELSWFNQALKAERSTTPSQLEVATTDQELAA